jgi:hypothetical protein
VLFLLITKSEFAVDIICKSIMPALPGMHAHQKLTDSTKPTQMHNNTRLRHTFTWYNNEAFEAIDSVHSQLGMARAVPMTPTGFIWSASFSLLSSRTSLSILSMPRSLRARCHHIRVMLEHITSKLTDKHFSYCSNIGLHSSVVAVPLKNSASCECSTCASCQTNVLSLYHFRKQLS